VIPTDDSVHFGLVELDLLATHAGVPVPFPLRAPSFGRITGEREVLLAAAGQTLGIRGLADNLGPLGAAAELATALSEHRGAVDLVLMDAERTVGVAALLYGSWALICQQEFGRGRVHVRRVVEDALVDELCRMVPVVVPVRSMPITLTAGVEPEALGQLGELTGFGVSGASRHGRRIGTELSWLDGSRGRVRISNGPDGWVSVNPLHGDALRAAVTDIVGLAR
jgi:hypothetical protein